MSDSLRPHGQNTGVGSFPSPGKLPNPGLWYCRQILYHLSHRETQLSEKVNLKTFSSTYLFMYMKVFFIYINQNKSQQLECRQRYENPASSISETLKRLVNMHNKATLFTNSFFTLENNYFHAINAI